MSGITELSSFSGTDETSLNDDLARSFNLSTSHISFAGIRLDSGAHSGRDGLCRYSFVDADTINLTRTYSNPANAGETINGAAYAVEWPSSMISSIQFGTIALSGSEETDTATISSVDLDYSVIVCVGWDSTGANPSALALLTFDDATTVRATSPISGSTRNVNFFVIEFNSSVVASLQFVSGTIATGQTISNNTISSVDTANTVCFYAGHSWVHTTPASTTYNTWNSTCAMGFLQSATNFRVQRDDSDANQTATLNTFIVEFVDGYLNVQRGQTSIDSASDPFAVTSVSSVALDKSFINTLNFLTAATGGTEGQTFGTVVQTDVDEITLTRGSVSSTNYSTYSWELVTFDQAAFNAGWAKNSNTILGVGNP